MRLEYKLKVNDYIELMNYLQYNVKYLKKRAMIIRFLPSLLMLVTGYICSIGSSLKGYLVMFSIIILGAILWIIIAPYFIRLGNIKTTKSMFNTDNIYTEMNIIVEIKDKFINVEGHISKSELPIKNIQSIKEYKSYLYIFFSATDVIIIPNQVFDNEINKSEFIKLLN